MGGLVFDNTADPTQCPLPDGRNSVTITSRGIVLLAELAPELIPDISLEAIRDKSKTNSLAKLICCLQASWFCLQVVTRLAQHLPVTLLELNTFAHAFCALLIFALWWDKPFDITEPFVLPVSTPPGHPTEPEIQRAAAICAAMCNCSEIGSQFRFWRKEPDGEFVPYRQTRIVPYHGAIIEADFANYLQFMVEKIYTGESELYFYRLGEGETSSIPIELPRDFPLTIARAHVFLSSGGVFVEFHSELVDGSTTTFAWDTFNRQRRVHVELKHVFSVPMLGFFNDLVSGFSTLLALGHRMEIPSDYWDRTRLIYQEKSHLRLQAQQEGDEDGEQALAPHSNPTFTDAERRRILKHTITGSPLICDRSTNWISHDAIRSSSTSPESLFDNSDLAILRFLAPFAVASIAYGGWHLLAWAGPFRGHTEMVLWRGSGIGLGAAAVALLLCYLTLMLIASLREYVTCWDSVVFTVIRGVVLLTFLFILFLTACRLSLVIESLIGLAYVPDGVFELPNWALYFPHIA